MLQNIKAKRVIYKLHISEYKNSLMFVGSISLCFFLYIYLLACSITLVISNTTCYLQMLFTLLFILLFHVFFRSLPCIVVVLLLFNSVSCVSFLNFVHPFCEFYKCFVVSFYEQILFYGPIIGFCYFCY
jgi:hypothetical protein